MALPGFPISTTSIDEEGIAKRAYEKELRRLASLRTITLTVHSADDDASPDAATLSFTPFTLDLPEDTRLGDAVSEVQARLPADSQDTQTPPYVYEIGYTGRRWYKVLDRSNGALSAVVGEGTVEIEVRVSVAPPLEYEKEEGGKGKGMKGLLGRMKSGGG